MADDLSSATPYKPGTKFFAPQARLVTAKGEALMIADQPVSQDIVSLVVTLVNTGVSQVEIVLNNQRHDARYRPLSPSWRYNKMDPVGFGARVRVDMRYGDEGWTPMMLARITDVSFLFPPAAGAQVTLKGEDLYSLLKAKPEMPHIYFESQEIDAVSGALGDVGSDLTLATATPSPFSKPLDSITHEMKQTFQQFIEGFAERMDYEVFVDFDDGSPVKGAVERKVQLHFEPARSGTKGDPVPLVWGRDIIEFKPTFKVWEVLTQAVAAGNVPRGRGRIEKTVQTTDAINDLYAGKDGGALVKADEARERAFTSEGRKPPVNSESVDVANIDEERAELKAKAVLRRSARQFLTADITTIGYTKLKPGIHVDLSGFYPPFDGVYYVTQTVHTLSAAGYTTKTSVRRPGMLDPAKYPGG
jgi:phage protein D